MRQAKAGKRSVKHVGPRTATLSESLVKVEAIMGRANDVLGSSDAAMRWLGTPVRALDFATPISLLASEEGAQRVNDVLGQMEHGVW